MTSEERTIKRVMIYRLGSLGDTVVALPSFHLIARVFPNAKRYLLGGLISNSRASHASAILCDSGLIHDYISYPVGLRNMVALDKLRREITALQPDILVYLAAPRGPIKVLRDVLFFKWCGIKKIIGVPFMAVLRENQWLDNEQRYEHESHRLARCISVLGSPKLDSPESWDLHLTHSENERTRKVLCDLGKDVPFIACGVGSKVEVKDWGKASWEMLLQRLFHRYRGFAVVFVGAKAERDLCDQIGRSWIGKKLNLSGLLTPRESASVLGKATLFIGHDGGPMHLAAAMGTTCVAIFSARNKPGVWFPYGENHHVFYHQTECYGCALDVCAHEAKKCITSITVEEVEEAVQSVLQNVKAFIAT